EVAVVVGEPDEPPGRALPRVPLPIEVRHVLLVLGQPLARFGDQLARARDVLAPRVAEHEPLQRIESGAQRALVLLGRGGQEPQVRRLVFPARDAGAKGGVIGFRVGRVALHEVLVLGGRGAPVLALEAQVGDGQLGQAGELRVGKVVAHVLEVLHRLEVVLVLPFLQAAVVGLLRVARLGARHRLGDVHAVLAARAGRAERQGNRRHPPLSRHGHPTKCPARVPLAPGDVPSRPAPGRRGAAPCRRPAPGRAASCAAPARGAPPRSRPAPPRPPRRAPAPRLLPAHRARARRAPEPPPPRAGLAPVPGRLPCRPCTPALATAPPLPLARRRTRPSFPTRGASLSLYAPSAPAASAPCPPRSWTKNSNRERGEGGTVEVARGPEEARDPPNLPRSL